MISILEKSQNNMQRNLCLLIIDTCLSTVVIMVYLNKKNIYCFVKQYDVHAVFNH